MDNTNGQPEVEAYSPSLPFAISCIFAGRRKRYMLYDIDLVTWLRREHHILGVLLGSLPQAPSQSVFLGLPLELMAEEARLLVEKDLAFISDDRDFLAQSRGSGVSRSQRDRYQADLTRRGVDVAEARQREKDARMEAGLRKVRLQGKADPRGKKKSRSVAESDASSSMFEFDDSSTTPTDDTSRSLTPKNITHPFRITPKTAGHLTAMTKILELPVVVKSSYALFKMLHGKGYFFAPGLRFGCQYMAYPGDPLRYHSHFLTVAADWDKKINLIDVIGLGRLATGVKKTLLLGGIESDDKEVTRAFSFEWAGM